MQRTLRAKSRGRSVIGALERRAESVADDVENAAVVEVDRILQQRVMARQRVWHRAGVLLEQPRRTFDVGEQEGDDASRESVHAASCDAGLQGTILDDVSAPVNLAAVESTVPQQPSRSCTTPTVVIPRLPDP
jgi:hypothetical protein